MTSEVDARPFDLSGTGDAAALCLHGLTGTPYEVRPLGEALSRVGLRAVGPALPGHNETPEALARVPHTAWLHAARECLAALRLEHERVFLVGLSLGGLLALELGAEQRVDGLVAIGTPLQLRARFSWALPLYRRIRPFAPKTRGSDIRDSAARARHPSYPVMPLAAVQELRRLQARVRATLVRVTAPVLVAHGARDSTAHPDDARQIAARVSSSQRSLVYFPDSAHIVPVDRDGPALSTAVAAWLRQLA